jgi:LysM repeat protein
MTSLLLMARIARALGIMLCCAPGALLAQEPAGTPAADELKSIHQMLDQQSRQLDVLAQEIARLNLLLEAKNAGVQGVAPTPAESPAPAHTEAPAPRAIPVEPASSPAGPVHIVSKGETLTAIAKRYKVTVPDLLKVNKITDVRKLQIGQTLVLPPGAKLQESPTPTPTPKP